MMKLNLLRKLLDKDLNLIAKYAFDEDGNLDFGKTIVQEGLMAIPEFKAALVAIAKEREVKEKTEKSSK